MEEGFERARRNRRAANPFLRRRTDCAQGPRGVGAARDRRRAVQQPHYIGGAAAPGKKFRAGRRRANRAALMPTIEQIEETSRIVEEAAVRLKGILAIDYVVPDYYALRPKKCMGGWGRQFFNISPAGKVLPCHAAESITGLEFESVRSNHSIAWIWQNSEAFNRYRGTGWMPEPCKSCEFPDIAFVGCRCHAFALTGDAGNTDPACTLSPMHEEIFKQAQREAAAHQDRFLYRNFAGGTLETEGEHGA